MRRSADSDAQTRAGWGAAGGLEGWTGLSGVVGVGIHTSGPDQVHLTNWTTGAASRRPSLSGDCTVHRRRPDCRLQPVTSDATGQCYTVTAAATGWAGVCSVGTGGSEKILRPRGNYISERAGACCCTVAAAAQPLRQTLAGSFQKKKMRESPGEPARKQEGIARGAARWLDSFNCQS